MNSSSISRPDARDAKLRTEGSVYAADLDAAPFAEGGVGRAMELAGHAYLEDYVFSLEDGPDHQPTEFERALLEDFMAGLLMDEAMFGPVRTLIAIKRELLEALRAMLRATDFDDREPWVVQANAAIAKALPPQQHDQQSAGDQSREAP